VTLRLSIIIVSYNAGVILLDVLAAIPEAVGALPYEVMLSDNGSSDGMVERVRAAYPEVRILQNENRGFAAGNNRGMEVARGDMLLLLNPDAIALPGSLARLVAHLDTAPDVGMCAPRTIDGRGQVALNAYGAYTPTAILWNYLGLARLFPDRVWGRYARSLRESREPFAVAWVQASCLLTRRAVYEQIGGMDERLFLFAEDPDWCERAARAGWRIDVVPDAILRHLESTTVSRYPYVKMLHYHLSPLHYFRARGRRADVLALRIGFTLELGAKWAIRLAQRAVGRGAALDAKLDAYPKVIRAIWSASE